MRKIIIFILAIFVFSTFAFAASPQKMENKYFSLDANSNGITRLMRTNDKYPTNYLIAGGSLGDVVIAYGTDPCAVWTRAGGVTLLSADNSKAVYKVSLAEQPAQLDILSTFALKGDSLIWQIDIKNLTNKVMEVGDVGIPLRLNTQYSNRRVETYTLRVMRHFLIAQNGSFVMAMRTNAEPPYLVMFPVENTWLEYFDSVVQPPPLAAGAAEASPLMSIPRPPSSRKFEEAATGVSRTLPFSLIQKAEKAIAPAIPSSSAGATATMVSDRSFTKRAKSTFRLSPG